MFTDEQYERLKFLRWAIEHDRLKGDNTIHGPSSQPITPTSGYPRWVGEPPYTGKAS